MQQISCAPKCLERITSFICTSYGKLRLQGFPLESIYGGIVAHEPLEDEKNRGGAEARIGAQRKVRDSRDNNGKITTNTKSLKLWRSEGIDDLGSSR